MKNRQLIWRICCVAAVLIMVLAYSPVFIPQGQIHPSLMGIPYTLWTGILICILMVVITYLATLVHPGREEELTRGEE